MSKSRTTFSPLIPWADRFNRPTVDRLGAALPPGSLGPYRQARRMLHEIGLVSEVVAWRGECWKWTVEFRAFPAGDTMAILVPAPENPQLALPLTREFLESLPLKRLKKGVREGLELASEPFDTNLAIWSLAPGSLISDLHDLLLRRVRHLARKTG